jgi:hypothetical protein
MVRFFLLAAFLFVCGGAQAQVPWYCAYNPQLPLCHSQPTPTPPPPPPSPSPSPVTNPLPLYCVFPQYAYLPACHSTPSPPAPVSGWVLRYSPGMPVYTNGSFTFPFGESCPSWYTNGQYGVPSNYNGNPCHQVDYFTYPRNAAVSPGMILHATFTLAGNGQIGTYTETAPGCGYPGGPGEIFLFLEHTGDDALINLGWRWWSANPVLMTTNGAYTPGTYSVAVPLVQSSWGCVQGACTNAQFLDVLANLGNAGFSFGGGCAKGHGNFMSSGWATFAVGSWSFSWN